MENNLSIICNCLREGVKLWKMYRYRYRGKSQEEGVYFWRMVGNSVEKRGNAVEEGGNSTEEGGKNMEEKGKTVEEKVILRKIFGPKQGSSAYGQT